MMVSGAVFSFSLTVLDTFWCENTGKCEVRTGSQFSYIVIYHSIGDNILFSTMRNNAIID